MKKLSCLSQLRQDQDQDISDKDMFDFRECLAERDVVCFQGQRQPRPLHSDVTGHSMCLQPLDPFRARQGECQEPSAAG